MPYNVLSVVANILKAAKESGRSDRSISLAAVGYDSAIKSLKKGHEPRLGTILAIAEELGLDLFTWKSDIQVDWYGYISAGGGADPLDSQAMISAEHPDETTNAPPALSSDDLQKHGGLSALTVRGESMQPVYNDGDTIFMYLDDPMASSPENLIGRDCAVTLSADDASDGTVYLKRLRRSDVGDKGIFNLESINPLWPMMRNQKIIRALPVRYVERL